MDHPFFDNRRFFIPYFFVWILLIAVQAYLLNAYMPVSREEAVVISLVFNGVFILLNLLSWYPVRAIYANYSGTLSLFSTWLVLILFLLAIWLSVIYMLTVLFFPEQEAYRELFFRLLPWQAVSGFLLGVITLTVYYLFISEEKLQEKTLQEAALKSLITETELQLLKNQLNPHFLFNTLNNIGNMILQHPDDAREMLVKLSGYLRNVLDYEKRAFSLIREEMEQIRLYLDLEKIRFEERWTYRETMGEACEDHPVPVMILQPLFENAVRYACYEGSEKSFIYFSCRKREGGVEISLANSYDPEIPVPEGQGIGLRNIQKRLSLIYGRNDLLQIIRKEDTFEVRLIIPFSRGEHGTET